MQTISFLIYIEPKNLYFLDRTLESLRLQQAKFHSEYIFVLNGFTPSQSPDINLSINKKLNNTTVINSEEVLTLASIRQSLSITSGDYVFFLRSGDYIPATLTQNMLDYINSSKSSINSTLVPKVRCNENKYNKFIKSSSDKYESDSYIKSLSNLELIFRKKFIDSAVFCSRGKLKLKTCRYELPYYELNIILQLENPAGKNIYIPRLGELISPSLTKSDRKLQKISFLYTKIDYIYNHLKQLESYKNTIARNLAYEAIKLLLCRVIINRDIGAIQEIFYLIKYLIPGKKIESKLVKVLLSKLKKLADNS
jgi:hypothetical protein